MNMDMNLTQIKADIYDKIGFEISNFKTEAESKEYAAFQFELNGRKILSRTAKITPKKIGQFVTFWKRFGDGPIEPFNENDDIDFYIINVRSENNFGQFVFPKAVLIQKGLMSTSAKEGKRGFRVYPSWDEAINKQAQRTQKWQLDFFYKIDSAIDLNMVKEFYEV